MKQFLYIIYARKNTNCGDLKFHAATKVLAKKAAYGFIKYLKTTESEKFYFKKPSYKGEIII